jgi:hypothetical protein
VPGAAGYCENRHGQQSCGKLAIHMSSGTWIGVELPRPVLMYGKESLAQEGPDLTLLTISKSGAVIVPIPIPPKNLWYNLGGREYVR